jgi:hypothetical protein
MRFVHKNLTGQPWACPGHPRLLFLWCSEDVDARDKRGHDDRVIFINTSFTIVAGSPFFTGAIPRPQKILRDYQP